MALKVGAATVTDVKLGAAQVLKVMLGAEQVWPVGGPVTGYWIRDGNKRGPDKGHFGVRSDSLYVNYLEDADGNLMPGVERVQAGWTAEVEGEDGTVDLFVVSDAHPYTGTPNIMQIVGLMNTAAYNGRTHLTFTPPTP